MPNERINWYPGHMAKTRRLLAEQPHGECVTLGVHPSRVSLMTGQKRQNIEELKRRFGLKTVKVVKTEVKDGEICLLP